MPLPFGATYVADFINDQEAGKLLEAIARSKWQLDLKRRVQHYGYRYDYRARKIIMEDYLGTLPSWLDKVCRKLISEGHFSVVPDQVIVNEYQPGQGIGAHVDCVPCFGNTIASLSLGSHCEMQFVELETGEKSSQLLERNSLLILTGHARYGWSHAIPARKSDVVEDARVARSRRVSLTFRNILIEN